MTKQQEADFYHLHDVDQRLTDGEIEIDGKKLTAEETKDYMYRNALQIINLGREGWNPFDTVSIVEGEEPEG